MLIPQSINAFKSSNSIQQSIKELHAMAIVTQLPKNETIVRQYKFTNLESIIINGNLSCTFQPKQFLYLLSIYNILDNSDTGIIKVGISINPENRAENLTKEWESEGVYFKVKAISKKSSRTMEKTERLIHKLLDDMDKRYYPIVKLTGHTELFYDTDFIESLVSSY